jgi:hypothetical protein
VEIAAIIIPLIVILIYKPKGSESRPLVLYVLIAFFLNFMMTAIAKNQGYFSFLPSNNHIYYNLHSLTKVVFFGWYLFSFRDLKSSNLIKIAAIAFSLFFAINFLFFEPITLFSTRTASMEGICLLVFCSSFFISTITDNSDTIWMNKPVFILCASINFYAALNFFVFLFFDYINVEKSLGDEYFTALLIAFSFSYFLLCIVLAVSLKKISKPLSIQQPVIQV